MLDKSTPLDVPLLPADYERLTREPSHPSLPGQNGGSSPKHANGFPEVGAACTFGQPRGLLETLSASRPSPPQPDLSQVLGDQVLGKARAAFDAQSFDASRTAHSSQAIAARFGPSDSEEDHKQPGGWQKDLTNGAMDGLLSSSIIIAGALGVGLAAAPAIGLTVSIILVNGLALAIGEYVSANSYEQYVRREMEREEWEMTHYPEGEIAEMIQLFARRGMHIDDAESAIRLMAKCGAVCMRAPGPTTAGR